MSKDVQARKQKGVDRATSRGEGRGGKMECQVQEDREGAEQSAGGTGPKGRRPSKDVAGGRGGTRGGPGQVGQDRKGKRKTELG